MTRISNLSDGSPTQSGDEIAIDRGGTMVKVVFTGAIEFQGHTHVFSDLTDNIADSQVPQSAVTQYEGAINHDALSGFLANEHIDWTADQGGTQIHENNVPTTPSKFIGEVFALQDDITGVSAPDNSGSVKYIKLTAGLTGVGQYNEGLLTSESTSGSSPNVVATAVIDHTASPMDGQTVRLINTEERFLRAGNAGTTQDWAIENIVGKFEACEFGNSTKFVGAGTTGPFSSDGSGGSDTETGGTGGGPRTRIHFDASAAVNTDTETRPRNLGISYYMRIA